jgi:16S rRNA (uracil1498-N3)-methyltransferase
LSRQIRVPLSELGPGLRDLTRESAHYLCVVHRLTEGDEFVAFDPEHGLESLARITRVERTRAVCELATPTPARKLSSGVTLLQSTAKADKLEQVVRAATALGAERVVLVVAERSVSRPADVRRERLRALAIEAARQSGRGDLPSIEGPRPLTSELTLLRDFSGLKLCLAPRGRSPLVELLHGHGSGCSAVVLVGPEGGLTDGELEAASDAGFVAASLGPLTLRTELAAIAALGCFAGRLPGAL